MKIDKKTITIYESPWCETLDLAAAEIICGSMDQLYEYEGEFEW